MPTPTDRPRPLFTAEDFKNVLYDRVTRIERVVPVGADRRRLATHAQALLRQLKNRLCNQEPRIHADRLNAVRVYCPKDDPAAIVCDDSGHRAERLRRYDCLGEMAVGETRIVLTEADWKSVLRSITEFQRKAGLAGFYPRFHATSDALGRVHIERLPDALHDPRKVQADAEYVAEPVPLDIDVYAERGDE